MVLRVGGGVEGGFGGWIGLLLTELKYKIYIQKNSKVNSCARRPRLLHSGVSEKKKVYGGRAKTSVQIKTKSYYIWSLKIGCKGGAQQQSRYHQARYTLSVSFWTEISWRAE